MENEKTSKKVWISVLLWTGLLALCFAWRYAIALFDKGGISQAVVTFTYMVLAGIMICAMEVGYTLVRKIVEKVEIKDKTLFNFWIVLRAIGAEIFCIGYFCVAKAATFQMFGRLDYLTKNAETGKLEWAVRHLSNDGRELQFGVSTIAVALIAIWVFSFVMRHSIDRFSNTKWYFLVGEFALFLLVPTFLTTFMPTTWAILICLVVDMAIGGVQLFLYTVKLNGKVGLFIIIRNYVYIAACALATIPLTFLVGSYPNRLKTVLLNGLIGLPISLIFVAFILLTSKSFIEIAKEFREEFKKIQKEGK